MNPLPDPKPPATAPGRSAQAANSAWNMLDSRVVTRSIQVVAVLSLLLALMIGLRQYALADCLARYSDDNARTAAERLKAAEQDRQALDNMITAIAGARSASPEDAQRQVNSALDTYIASRAAADEQRRRNPPPAPPAKRCR